MPIDFYHLWYNFFLFSSSSVNIIISIHFFIYLFIPLSPSSELSLLLQSEYIFFSFIYSFHFLPQSAQQHVSKTPTYFRKAEVIGMTTGMSVISREVAYSPSKLKKNGSLSIRRFKSVVPRILARGTLVQGRWAEFGLGRVENN